MYGCMDGWMDDGWMNGWIKLSEGWTKKVADVLTGVVQDAMLDHMGSDFRCQSRVMTTRNC